MNEEEILSGINNKHKKEWSFFYGRFYAALCSYVTHILKNPDNSEDLVQEVFIAIWNMEKKFVSMRELTNYLYKACYNNALVFVRNNHIRNTILNTIGGESDFTADDVFALTVKQETVRQLYFHIETLPEKQKQVILMNIEGYSCDEIAKELNISQNTVKTHKNRGFASLRAKLDHPALLLL